MAKAKRKKRTTNFYEAMPGFMNSYDVFATPADMDVHAEEVHELSPEDQARQQMVRQGVLLLGLLGLQVVLFIILIQSTINLG